MAETMAQWFEKQTQEREARARHETEARVRLETEAMATERTLRGAVEAVLEARFGELPAPVKKTLSTADTSTLQDWLRLAANAATLDEFGATLKND